MFKDMLFVGGFNSLLIIDFADSSFTTLKKLNLQEKNPICDIALHGTSLIAVNGDTKILSWNFSDKYAKKLLNKISHE